jgi:hypothetical protein
VRCAVSCLVSQNQAGSREYDSRKGRRRAFTTFSHLRTMEEEIP